MPNKDVLPMAKKALFAIQNTGMVLELNVSGYRKDVAEAYPSKELLEEAYLLGIPITFSSDAHKPEQVALYNDEIIALAKSVGYTECVYFKKRKMFTIEF
jgi:histidinol-phosphatase (PHP family)